MAVHWSNRGVSRRKEPYENEGLTTSPILRPQSVFFDKNLSYGKNLACFKKNSNEDDIMGIKILNSIVLIIVATGLDLIYTRLPKTYGPLQNTFC